MQVVAELKDISLLEKKNVFGWIVSLKGLSCYYDKTYNIEEVKRIVEIAHQNNQKVYINARKVIHEQDIEKVLNIILELEKLDVDYYFYGDMGFYEIAEELTITHKLIYQVNTYMTNSLDIDMMIRENHSVVVSTEISFEELLKVVENNQKELYLHIFGHYPIFHSRRELISNYFKYRGFNEDLEHNFDIVEELRESHYPIEQNENGMVVYIDGVYVIASELEELEKNNSNLIGIMLSKNINATLYAQILDLYSTKVTDEELLKLKVNLTKGLLYEQSKLLKKEGGMVLE